MSQEPGPFNPKPKKLFNLRIKLQHLFRATKSCMKLLLEEETKLKLRKNKKNVIR